MHDLPDLAAFIAEVKCPVQCIRLDMVNYPKENKI